MTRILRLGPGRDTQVSNRITRPVIDGPFRTPMRLALTKSVPLHLENAGLSRQPGDEGRRFGITKASHLTHLEMQLLMRTAADSPHAQLSRAWPWRGHTECSLG